LIAVGFRTQAWVCESSDAEFTLQEVELDSPRADEVLVEVTATGICHADIEGKSVLPLPAVLGHEGVGVVREVGSDVSRVRAGDRVVMSYGYCGHCDPCRTHRPFHCDEGWELTFSGHRLDGSHTVHRGDQALSACFFQQSSFARHALCTERNLVVVDADVPDTLLAALPCGVLTGAGIVTCQFGMSRGSSLGVFGAGAVGLSAVMAAARAGVSPLVAVDVHASRLELARELGASHVINAREGDVCATLREICPRGLAYAIDATANEAGFNNAISCLGTGGRLAVCNLPPPMEEFGFKPFDWFTRCASLEAVSFGNAVAQELIPRMVEWFESGEFSVDRLISVYPFSDINLACADSEAGRSIKPVLDLASCHSENHRSES
jgi:aryl-alcohol dehydrogenase